MRTISKLVLVTLGVSALACSADGYVSEPTEQQEEAIYYGDLDYSHQAVVTVMNGSGVCTGTIIKVDGSIGYVLTAAHCVTEDGQYVKPASQFSVYMGNDYNSPSASFNVIDVDFHPLYDGSDGSANDFAMLKISGVSNSTPSIPAMTKAQDNLKVGDMVNLVGYGRTNTSNYNSKRYAVDQSIDDLNSGWLIFDQSGTNGGTCQGDSGGPAVYELSGNELVAAVTSFGTGMSCTEDSYSGRVSTVYDSFINKFMQGASYGPYSCDECYNSVTAGEGSCVSKIEACFSNNNCQSFYSCLQGCSDQACLNECTTNNPTGADMYNAIYDCVCSDCAAECGDDALCAGPTGCALTTGNATCDNCFGTKCESECTTATEEPSLNDYLGCVQGCSDQACMDGCNGQYPEASAAFDALDACMSANCAEECGASTGACQLATGNQACDDCFQTACENECVTAMEEPSLNDYLTCAQACSDQACVDECGTQYPDAADVLGVLDTCMGNNCAEECGTGTGGTGGGSGTGGTGGGTAGTGGGTAGTGGGTAGTAGTGGTGGGTAGTGGGTAGTGGDPGTAGTAGDPGTAGTAGDPTTPGTGGTTGTPATPTSDSSGDDSGCSTSTGNANTSGAGALVLLGAALAFLRRRH